MLKVSNNKTAQMIFASLTILILVIFFSTPFWIYKFDEFYKTCSSIMVGQVEADVKLQMAPFISSSEYVTAYNSPIFGYGVFIANNQSAHQCNIAIKDGKVRVTELVFQ